MIRRRCWARLHALVEARRFRLLVPLAVLGVLTLPATPAGAGAPSDALKDFFGAVNLVLTDPTTEDRPMERLRAIRRHVDDVFDFREASMLALGREWTSRTPVEQNEFVALFAELLERSFVWRVAGKATTAGGVTVRYLGEVVDGETASVETQMAARDGNDLRLDFRMVHRGGRWVVRDVVMDGVSTMDNYHAQFQRLARDGAWPDLMAQLRAKVGAPGDAVQVASATPPTMWPSDVRAPARVAEPLVSVPAPPVPASIARPLETAVVLPRAAQPPAPARTAIVSAAPERVVVEPPAAPSVPPPTVHVPPTVPVPPTAAGREPSPSREKVSRGPARDVVLATPATRRVEPRIEPRPMARPAVARPSTSATYWVQVGAYRNAAAAGRVAALVRGEILVVPSTTDSRSPLLRVRVGPFDDRTRASARLHELQAQGWRAFIAEGRD